MTKARARRVLGVSDGPALPKTSEAAGRACLEDAIALAVSAHRGQVDKAGAPYVLHPLRVMLPMESDTEKMAAVLHDVVEDTDVTLADLERHGFPPAVVEAVAVLTHEGDDYEAYIARVEVHPLARRIKRADLEDNMDLGRLAEPTDRDWARLRKYRRLWGRLGPGGSDPPNGEEP